MSFSENNLHGRILSFLSAVLFFSGSALANFPANPDSCSGCGGCPSCAGSQGGTGWASGVSGDWGGPGVPEAYETFDATTDLNYYNYRYYAPGIGRWTKRDVFEENGEINLYGMCYNNLFVYFDSLGLWLPKNHKLITQIAFFQTYSYVFPSNMDDSTLQTILSIIVKSNIDTDSGEMEDRQEFHYCTDYKETGAELDTNYSYKQKYATTITEQITKWYQLLNTNQCQEALKILGTLTHMWQDYYAHGVVIDKRLHKLQAISGLEDEIGEINGSPDWLIMEPVTFGLSGFSGMHGGFFQIAQNHNIRSVEPGERAIDYGKRRLDAISFTRSKITCFFVVLGL